MESLIDAKELAPVLELVLAMLLGMLLGAERTIAGKTAGMRTFGLVAMGSCLFTLFAAGAEHSDEAMRVVAGIATGVGFIGAGLIILRDREVTGLTTAAGLWVAAGIGSAVGLGRNELAIAGTVLALIVYTVFWFVERGIERTVHPNGKHHPLSTPRA